MDELSEEMRRSEYEEACDYNYAPLQHPDSIRLLELLPGEMESPIQIDLAEFRLQENPLYEALSYTWATEDGDCSLSSQIRCGKTTRLWITKNCELALRYLRETDSRRILWVDAICINQNDINERGHQVGMMRDIYSQAPRVLVWLGEASKDLGTPLSYMVDSISPSALEAATGPLSRSGSSGGELSTHEAPPNDSQATISVSEIFLNFLEEVVDDMIQISSTGQASTLSSLYQELISQIHEGWTNKAPEAKSQLYRGFVDIVNRRWWTRVWVVQEVVSAKSVILVCSKKRTDYTYFRRLHLSIIRDMSPKANDIFNSFSVANGHLTAVRGAFRATEASAEPSAFLEVLHEARGLFASNPCDKVFGVLGLSDKFNTLAPAPDYSKSPTEVFTDLAKSFLSTTKSLSILEHATSTNATLGHPSWAPYWPNGPVIYFNRSVPYHASKKSEAIFTISPNSQYLRVKGKVFDQVTELPLAELGAYTWEAGFNEIIEGYRVSCKVGFSLTSYPTGEPVEEALWRSLCWNFRWGTDYTMIYPAPDELAHSFREWYYILMASNTLEVTEREFKNQRNPFAAEINDTSPLGTTKNGYLAAVPYTTEVGDFIALLAGGRLPFILRPTGDHYCFVGPCYVHGIMNGEAFPDTLDGLQWFSIR
ncbi:HET-domain-containing protein [Hyaloscypha variabilis F]|uniref:HET-domain-containing protein n=1 Tax=Hyaloscypha variabilis (strain UAMH 11265 / GT02V1 / F) TaxID=1149755 RepID=A0A2J6RZH1_HYAVF|nr:HET-domain-containing protein [Hyaloscypha variabilis F]